MNENYTIVFKDYSKDYSTDYSTDYSKDYSKNYLNNPLLHEDYLYNSLLSKNYIYICQYSTAFRDHDIKLKSIAVCNNDNFLKYFKSNIKNCVILEYYTNNKNSCNDDVFFNTNMMLYIAKYPDQILINNDKILISNIESNFYLKNKLVTEYKTALFWCPKNTGIIGIDGYKTYDNKYLKYLDTLDTVYIINSDFEPKFLKGFKNIVYINNVNVPLFLKTYPKLNAFYRQRVTQYTFYISYYYKFKKIAKISDNIYLGNNSYDYTLLKNCDSIIDVSDSYTTSIILTCKYYKIPIIENKESYCENKKNLIKAVELLNEHVENNLIVYIHCYAGVNRSPLVVILYLIKYKKFTLYQAYKHVAEVRQIWTMSELFDILYEIIPIESIDISPLKICNHLAFDNSKILFSLYDYIHLDQIK